MLQPRLALALNTSSEREAVRWINLLRDGIDIIKVGMPLLVNEGPSFVEEIKKFDKEIFLDLKLHDIPAVVRDTIGAAASLGVDYITIHATGGFTMMRDAVKAKRGNNPYLLGVTVLSSLTEDDLILLGVGKREDITLHLAEMAVRAGLDGVVASGREVGVIRKNFPDLLIVCPGIRPKGVSPEDQKAHLTPGEAVRLGANILVVGRPITGAKDPTEALQNIKKEMEEVFKK